MLGRDAPGPVAARGKQMVQTKMEGREPCLETNPYCHAAPHTHRHKHMQPTAKQPLLPAMTSHGGSPGQAPEPPRAQPLSHRVGLCQAVLSCLPRDPPTWQSW